MTTDFYVFEMLTGRRLQPLPVSSGTWKVTTNADEQTSCSMLGATAAARMSRVWESTTLARNGLLVVVDDVPVAAGPIWKRKYTQGGNIELTASGLRSYWERRILLPVAARDRSLILANGDPDTTLDFAVSGVDYGTVAKRYVQLVTAWPGGAVPLQLPADRAGTRVDTVAAIDLKTVRRVLDNLSGLQNGPDIAFRPRWNEDRSGIFWELQTGTEAQPRLGNPDASLLSWTVGGPTGGAYGLEVDEDGTSLTEEVFGTGGSSSDQVVYARSRSTALSDAGFPLLQSTLAGNGTVKDPANIQSKADRAAALGSRAASFMSMRVRAHERGTAPLGDWWLGDMATVVVDRAEPVFPAGDYPRRVASIGGDAVGDAYAVTFAEALA